MRRRHIESAQRTVRYHSAAWLNWSPTIAPLISFTIRFDCGTGSPPLFEFDVLCRRFTTVADDFELDLLTLIECAESGTFHRRDMNEHVLSASMRLDEAVAFGGVEPLYISCRHLDISNPERRFHTGCTFSADDTRGLRCARRDEACPTSAAAIGGLDSQDNEPEPAQVSRHRYRSESRRKSP